MKGTGAKRNVCPGSCVSTGAKFPVSPVESAPMHQVDHVPNGPSNSTAITTVFPLRLCEASYWSQSLESDATVRADYALTTTTSHICNEMIDRPIARLGVARPGVRECYLAILPHVRIWHCDLW